jgi:hypothetical protein
MNTTFPRFLGAGTMLAVVLTASAQANAPVVRYTIAGGTVTDTKTKLVWQQTAPAAPYGWANAMTYCPTLGASLGGTGWRLPTIKELQTIVDDSLKSPSIDPTAFPATPVTSFWSSSPSAGSPSTVWGVDFYDGSSNTYPGPDPHDVRCVR